MLCRLHCQDATTRRQAWDAEDTQQSAARDTSRTAILHTWRGADGSSTITCVRALMRQSTHRMCIAAAVQKLQLRPTSFSMTATLRPCSPLHQGER